MRVCVERDLLSTIVIRSSLDKASRWNPERVRVRKDLFVLALFEFFSRFFEPGETLCLAFRFEPSRAPSAGKEIPSRFEEVNEKKNHLKKIQKSKTLLYRGSGGRATKEHFSLCLP